MTRPTILAVDDEKLNVELLTGILSEDYNVETANSGEEALQKVEQNLPDLILLDIMMPTMDGYEVCRRIKANERTMSIPVVMVTALKEKKDRIKAIEAGADDFLSKPVDMYELTLRVKSLLRVKHYYDSLLKEQENLLIFKSALNSMDDCVIITNMSGDIKYVNPAFEEKFGYSRDKIIDKHISIINHQDSPLSLDKGSLIQDRGNEWKGNLIAVNIHGLKMNMSISASLVSKGSRKINLVFLLREKN